MTKTHLIPLTDALAAARSQHAELLAAARAWEEGSGTTTDPDHFALVCAGADDGSFDDVGPTRWTRISSYHVLRCDVPNWCSSARCLWPIELPQAMWRWFDFLDETGRLHPDSDPLGELRKPLLCWGGLDHRGRPRPPGAPRLVVCECFLPYRETAEMLHELTIAAEHGGADPLDALRSFVGRAPAHGSHWVG